MTRFANLVWKLRIWNDTSSQDLIEYALNGRLRGVAAGAIMPGAATSIIFSEISSALTTAAATS